MAEPSWNLLPDAACVLSAETCQVVAANRRFEKAIAPLSKISQLNFVENFVSKEDKARFKLALQRLSELPAGNRCVWTPNSH
jgi:hypothetical protein